MCLPFKAAKMNIRNKNKRKEEKFNFSLRNFLCKKNSFVRRKKNNKKKPSSDDDYGL